MRNISLVLIAVATLIIVSYQNCGKPVTFSGVTEGVSDLGDPVDGGNTGSVGDNGGNGDEEEDIIPSCQTSQLVTQIIDVNLNSINDCKWNDSNLDNLGKKNGYMQARHEELTHLTLPWDATICDMEFDFPEQTFEYDDHVILTFNDRILMNTGSDMHQYLNSDGSGYIYDWSKLKGKSQDVGSTQLYCNGNSTCSVPNTERLGKILVDIPKTTIQKIMTMAPKATHEIKMITTGDDDVGDCNHTPISFKVKVRYHGK